MKRRWNLAGLILVTLLVISACGQFNDKQEQGQIADPNPPAEPPQEEILTETVDLYFADQELMALYKVERDIEVKEETDLAEAALNEWIQGPEEDSLQGIVPDTTTVKELNIEGDLATVNFSSDIQKANVGSSGELFLLDQLALILQQFDVKQVQILVEDEKVETLFGHIKVDEPYVYQESSSYEIKTLD